MNREKKSENLYFGLVGAASLAWEAGMSLWDSLDVPSLLSHIWVSAATGGTNVLVPFGGKMPARVDYLILLKK
jgi:hypothetical protein